MNRRFEELVNQMQEKAAGKRAVAMLFKDGGGK